MALKDYGFGRTFEGLAFEEVRERIIQALASEGFAIIAEIDVQAILGKKLGVDYRKYLILGACNPNLAHKVLVVEPHAGLILPCNVVIQEQEKGTGIMVSVQSPVALFNLVQNPDLETVAKEADEKLRRVLASMEVPLAV